MVDIISHGLWSFLAFRKLKERKEIWAGIFFGIMPDLLSWTIYSIYLLFIGTIPYGKPNPWELPQWAFMLYNISHSLIICVIFLGFIYTLTKEFPIYTLGWPLHILIDIPTHSKEFLPTPFLWPISNWKFPGISWSNPWLFLLDCGLLIIFFIYTYLIKRKTKKIK
ncbi:MAG: hypothetical protein Q7S74_05860 [Nanoarchaeota archaeon]|nr:hypothetical protein [Nanoarchaeota archaeon]